MRELEPNTRRAAGYARSPVYCRANTERQQFTLTFTLIGNVEKTGALFCMLFGLLEEIRSGTGSSSTHRNTHRKVLKVTEVALGLDCLVPWTDRKKRYRWEIFSIYIIG